MRFTKGPADDALPLRLEATAHFGGDYVHRAWREQHARQILATKELVEAADTHGEESPEFQFALRHFLAQHDMKQEETTEERLKRWVREGKAKQAEREKERQRLMAEGRGYYTVNNATERIFSGPHASRVEAIDHAEGYMGLYTFSESPLIVLHINDEELAFFADQIAAGAHTFEDAEWGRTGQCPWEEDDE